MIVSVGININSKGICYLLYPNGSRNFEKCCSENKTNAAIIGEPSLISEDLSERIQSKVINLLPLLDVQLESDIDDVFDPLQRPATVNYDHGKVMIGRRRDRSELGDLFIGRLNKVLNGLISKVKDGGKSVELHITVTYPGYLSDTVRKKLQSFMEKAIQKSQENLKNENNVMFGPLSYMTEEEAIVFGHFYTTNSLDHDFYERQSFIVCDIGDNWSSITRVPYRSIDNVECEVKRIKKLH